jgi:AraC-like DNA-binding protein
MTLAMHRWRESAPDDRRELVELIDLQPPEAIICWDGLEASELRPRPRKWLALRPERVSRAADAQVSHPSLPRRALRSTVRYIHSNLDSKLTWEVLASAVGMGVFEFGRSFKMSTGMTPHQYVIRCRLRRAVKLLQYGEMSITDIALEVGCSCQSHLTTLFGRYIGTTPDAFRRAVKESPRLLGSVATPFSPHETNRQSTALCDPFRL